MSTANVIEATLLDTASLTGNKPDMISAKYDITPGESDDFFRPMSRHSKKDPPTLPLAAPN
jgi:hypothetical protein